MKTLKPIKNFKKDKKISRIENIVTNNQKEKIIMKAGAYIVLSILIVINAIQQNYNSAFMILNILVVIYSVYSVVINCMAFIKMNSK